MCSDGCKSRASVFLSIPTVSLRRPKLSLSRAKASLRRPNVSLSKPKVAVSPSEPAVHSHLTQLLVHSPKHVWESGGLLRAIASRCPRPPFARLLHFVDTRSILGPHCVIFVICNIHVFPSGSDKRSGGNSAKINLVRSAWNI